MVSASILVSAQGAKDLKELAQKIKEADRKDLRRKFRERIKAAGDSTVKDVRAAAMRVNVTRGNDPYIRRTQETGVAPRRSTDRWGPRATGLRARTARATGISLKRNGIWIKVSAKKFGDYGVTLPRRLDGTLPRWRKLRHPVFGNPEVWVEHKGEAYFFVTIRQHKAAFQKAVGLAIDDTKRELAR